MVTTYDGNPQKSIEKLADSLNTTIIPPEWTKFVKTGPSKERPPVQENWYKLRAASILRAVYLRGPIGVQKLRVKYGSKKNRGHKPEKFVKSSGKIIRDILQQLEKAGLIKYQKDSVHKGRIITQKGRSLVDKTTVKENGK